MGMFYWRLSHAGEQETAEAATLPPRKMREALETLRKQGPGCACCAPAFNGYGPEWDWRFNAEKGEFVPIRSASEEHWMREGLRGGAPIPGLTTRR